MGLWVMQLESNVPHFLFCKYGRGRALQEQKELISSEQISCLKAGMEGTSQMLAGRASYRSDARISTCAYTRA